MDRGYLSRIQEREPLIRDKAEFTVGAGPLVDPAIEELYTEIMIDYLPHRYPTIFKTAGQTVHNLITGSSYPLSTADLTPERMLQLLGMNVEEDFYFMCPDENDGEFRLRGYIACFPGGFLSPARLGESVREIHGPVPGYEERLGRSVDRYFKRMEPGQFIGRMNVSFPAALCVSVPYATSPPYSNICAVESPSRRHRPLPRRRQQLLPRQGGRHRRGEVPPSFRPVLPPRRTPDADGFAALQGHHVLCSLLHDAAGSNQGRGRRSKPGQGD